MASQDSDSHKVKGLDRCHFMHFHCVSGRVPRETPSKIQMQEVYWESAPEQRLRGSRERHWAVMPSQPRPWQAQKDLGVVPNEEPGSPPSGLPLRRQCDFGQRKSQGQSWDRLSCGEQLWGAASVLKGNLGSSPCPEDCGAK